ncbi:MULTISPECIES: ExeA family protein [Pseudoalteromonas]|uniref:AAA family ATPase n=1 Tax=Pseudoalteromonas amylolytica TaxID=1859457 RepID=A0A1S1MYC9_9GAMM|nr:MULTISPECIES: AAA family ATPase [Pseudoalteromonas]MCF6435894.1 AAA family ATPase [Pseudoalteromonas sp. MMG022]OHU89262.1 AAA family ATPase [Pseudoalteromonas sp. JW3]OHU92162.1 AAA family ATPase [Pseudoalteromonas amylolytica]
MYLRYFGLSEKPFSIAPNPEYLFLSDRHKEALAHLTYGLGDAGGFVLLTGEVGTGKTTVTRSMLAQLPETTQVAFILNPALSEIELLASICDELKIDYPAEQASLKVLTDLIKARLLENHALGGHTMLIIDEAQHLAAEVLEQLRLLTNLETDHKKLLQIVLVGQPELQHLLQRNELRQLAQRITARYHLLPLTQSQVYAYIQHRLQKAGSQTMIFDHDAIAYMHKVTAGIPRLLNLLADRCLLGAYSAQQQVVDKKIAMQAAKEALPLNLVPEKSRPVQPKVWWLSSAAFASFALGFVLSFIF